MDRTSLRNATSNRNRAVRKDELKKRRDDSGTTTITYVVGENEPFTGTEVRYHNNGSKREEASWVDNKLHGTKIDYYEDGSKKYEITLLNGKAHGTAIMYGWDGSKTRETVYENGEMIHQTEF